MHNQTISDSLQPAIPYTTYQYGEYDDLFYYKADKLLSYKWEFEEVLIEENKIKRTIYPLTDRLILEYQSKEFPDMRFKVTFLVFNWQLEGSKFDIEEFLKTPYLTYTKEGYPISKQYKGHNFTKSEITMYSITTKLEE